MNIYLNLAFQNVLNYDNDLVFIIKGTLNQQKIYKQIGGLFSSFWFISSSVFPSSLHFMTNSSEKKKIYKFDIIKCKVRLLFGLYNIFS